MAMVSCRECGQSVADSAPTCPNCGVVSPGGQAQLEIARVKRVQSGWLSIAVWVDSSNVGNLDSGQSITIPVTPGIHRIECRMQQAPRGATQEVEVPAGRRLLVTVAPSRWTGTPGFTQQLI